MAEIVWTTEARRWLQDIYEYISEDNEEAAYRTVLAIYERAETFLTFREIGYCYRGRPDVRVLMYEEYRIACLIASERDIHIWVSFTVQWIWLDT